MLEERHDAEDDLLTLGLGINSSTHSRPVSKKRKLNDRHESYLDDKYLSLLQARYKMLQNHPLRNKQGIEDGKGLQLIHLLLISATSIDSNNTSSALDSLTKLYYNASLKGEPIQRVTAYFADALVAKLLTPKSSFYDMIIANPIPQEKFSSFTYLYRASPYYQFAHFTANQAIIEAFEHDELNNDSKSLHVVDFDVSYGFQWPSLIQSLSDKATNKSKISFKLTGYGENVKELEETEMRLCSFANGCPNVEFEFNGALQEKVPLSKIKITKKETLVVNVVFHQLDHSTLRDIHALNPSLLILVEKEESITSRNFLSRFMESLHYFAAMFDSLDDCLPMESVERLSIEKNHLGREIKKLVVSNEDVNENYISCNNKFGKMESWKERMKKSRFEGVNLSSRSVSQAKLLIKIKSHCSNTNEGGFRILEGDDGKSLGLGWQDRNLITASAWKCMMP